MVLLTFENDLCIFFPSSTKSLTVAAKEKAARDTDNGSMSLRLKIISVIFGTFEGNKERGGQGCTVYTALFCSSCLIDPHEKRIYLDAMIGLP